MKVKLKGTNMTKRRIFEVIEKAENGDKESLFFDKFIILLIIVNVISIVLESFESVSATYADVFLVVEVISVVIFSLEYLARIFTANLLYPECNNLIAVFRYMKSPMALIDLFAILPFYLPFLIAIDLRFIRSVRLVRMFRLFKLNRYSKSMALISKVIKNEKDNLVVTVFITSLLILISSTMMYNFENAVQPEKFPDIVSSFWWSVATLTTVGYGDIYPVTVIGKFLSGFIALLGIGLVALPTGILSSGFMKEISSRNQSSNNYCSNCGKKLL